MDRTLQIVDSKMLQPPPWDLVVTFFVNLLMGMVGETAVPLID